MSFRFPETSARLGHQRTHASLHQSLSTQHLSRPFTCQRPASIRTTSFLVASANTMSASERQTSSSSIMQERMEFLKEDLQHLFDDKGIDKSQYDDVVEFRDPITQYNNASGYMFNISMLKRVFNPTFELHDIKQTGEYEATTRWTMTMEFALTKDTPVSKWWKPKLAFTGVSVMGINPENRKFNRHIDLWDAVENQNFFSFEAFQHVLAQLSNTQRQPDIPTPYYKTLRKYKEFEIRRYDRVLVAETKMDASSSGRKDDGSPAGKGDGAFNALAKYIFGDNASSTKMQMTTPVFTDDSGIMQFVIDPSFQDKSSLPAPNTDRVSVSERPSGEYAAITFSGVADPQAAAQKERELRALMQKRNISAAGSEWYLARYNDPSTKPAQRKNEILIPVKDFDLWESGQSRG